MILEKRILAPGIVLYKTDPELCNKIKQGIEKNIENRWKKAEVVNTETYEANQSQARKCFDYPLFDNNSPEQPINDLYNAVHEWINPCLEDFASFYSIEKIISGAYILLKYEQSDKFDWHIDDGGKYPRTVSVSAYLNNEYEGGELEFNHFGISHKPEKGDIVLFNSSFTYMHRVNPVTSGTRYAVVNWYRYANYPKVIDE
jgi:Rps23 Pro-64 3,4-dihydroxylase Tpa1-like proline 4-hydroxylase